MQDSVDIIIKIAGVIGIFIALLNYRNQIRIKRAELVKSLFEFIGVLYTSKQLTFKLVSEVFDYYLKKIKVDADCKEWIDRYSFEKLKVLLKKV